MRRLSHAGFVAEFPMTIPAAKMKGIDHSPIEVDGDTVLSGILGSVTVRGGAKVLLHGIIDGNLTVERDAVVYFEGIVKGDVLARGAICMDGIVNGKIHDEDGAAVAFDGIVGNEGRPKSS